MVLLDQVIQILDWTQLAASGQDTLLRELADSFRVEGTLIYIDHVRGNGMPGTQGFPEETLGRDSITPLAQ